MKRVRGQTGGFTLIEVMITTMLITMVLLIVLPTFTSILEAKDRIDKGGARQMREAQALMSIMRRDLRSAFLSKSAGADKFIIVNAKDLDGKEIDEIYFTSFSRYSEFDSNLSSDQCEVGYFVKKDDDGRMTLYRRESGVIDEDLYEGGVTVKLTDSITHFNIIAYTGGFSTENDIEDDPEDAIINVFPSGLMVQFGLKLEDGRVKEFETAFVLPAYPTKAEEPKDGSGKKGDKGKSFDDEKKG